VRLHEGARSRSANFADRRRSIEQTRPRPNPPGGRERAREVTGDGGGRMCALRRVHGAKEERKGVGRDDRDADQRKGEPPSPVTEYHNYYRRYSVGMLRDDPEGMLPSRFALVKLCHRIWRISDHVPLPARPFVMRIAMFIRLVRSSWKTKSSQRFNYMRRVEGKVKLSHVDLSLYFLVDIFINQN
jgi:hypothetical protein